MSDRYVEKSFLALLAISLLLHVAVGALLYYLPEPVPPKPKEPVFIDLQQMPELKAESQPRQTETLRQSDQRVRVPRETAPRGQDAFDRGRSAPDQSQQRVAPPSASSRQRETSKAPSQEMPIAPGSSATSLLKPKSPTGRQATTPQLFPGASRMARMEENYRRKYGDEIAEGETLFLNSDDILFGSFLRRFETAVYGVWRYPQEAAMKGIEGITPVRITFNRRGEIVSVKMLESSGAVVLDEEVLRTLRMIGPVGGFPKGYDKDEFHLIAFFQYGSARRSLR